MATKTKRSQKPVFEYQKPAIEAAATTRRKFDELLVANKVKRELTAEEQKRAKKLQEMILDLENDQHVQNRKLQTWLSKDEFARIDQEWQQEQAHREIYKDKPEEVRKYEAIVAEADFYFNRSEHYSLNGNHKSAHSLSDLAESTYERALEYLEEIIGLYPELRIWFDRETMETKDNHLGLDADSVPRTVTSRSIYSKSGVNTRAIRDVKLGVLRDVLRSLQYESADKSNVPTSNARLRTLLQLPDSDLT